MASDQHTVLEKFGHTDEGFDCFLCDKRRRYYDMLSDNSFVCLECSVKEDYQLDIHAAIHSRDPGLMFSDPELSEIRSNLVKWELSTVPLVPLGSVSIPKDLAEAVLRIHQEEGSSVNAIVASGLRMLTQVYAFPTEDQDEVQP